jgi:D-inositol-3-phosphate glycosyltransferase
VVAYVGRMLPRKDVRNLVRAFALFSQAVGDSQAAVGGELLARAAGEPLPAMVYPPAPRLLLVGGETGDPDPAATPEIGVLQQLAAELGIADRVYFTGKRQPDDLLDYYSASDIAVTTPWYEPFGLTPLEAMACGRPVIGSAVGGITFTIRDGVTGYLVPPQDPHALAERLYRLWAEPAERERMGRAARERVEREFTWQTVARRTAAIYQSLLATKDEGRTTNGQQVNRPSSVVRRPSSVIRRMGGK